MKTIKVSQLEPIEKLGTALLHKSSSILVEEGGILSQPMIDYMKELGIKKVYLLGEDDVYAEKRQELTHVKVELDSLKAGEKLLRAIYGPNGQLMLDEGAATPKNFGASLRRRGIESIFIRKSPEEMNLQLAKNFKARYEEMAEEARPKEEAKPFEGELVNDIKEIKVKEAVADDFDAKKLQKKLDAATTLEVKAEGEAFVEKVRDTTTIEKVTEAEKEEFSNNVSNSITSIKAAFGNIIRDPRSFNVDTLEGIVNIILAGTAYHRDLLNICSNNVSNENYMVSHPLAVSILSVNIGTAMGFGSAQIKSLAYGALLADIGLFKVPAEILNKRGKLSPREYAIIKRHPAIGLDLLEAVRGLPAEVPYIVYQSHERPNGGGYPCGKKDIVIHTFAKIVSIADSYLAICSDRPYRQGKTFYESMEQIIFMASKKMLNAKVIKSFLSCVSLFPIGSFVTLSDNHIGRVIAANPDDYMRPVISKLWTEDFSELSEEEQRINLMDTKDLSVTKVLESESVPLNGNLLIGF